MFKGRDGQMEGGSVGAHSFCNLWCGFIAFRTVCQLIFEAMYGENKQRWTNLIPYSYVNSTVRNAAY